MSNPTDNNQQPLPTQSTDQNTDQNTPYEAPTASKNTASTPVKSSNKTGKLALLIALLALLLLSTVAAFQYQQNQQIKTILSDAQSQLAQSKIHLTQQQKALKQLEQGYQGAQQDQHLLIEAQQTQSQQLIALTSQFSQLTGIRRQDWEIARLEYLLKTASQRLHLDSDVDGAIAALTTADEYLNIINDPALIMVREQISQDLHKLKSMNLLDRSGVYIQLDTLIRQIPQLQPMQPNFETTTIESPSEDTQFIDWVSNKLFGLVKITSTDIKPATAWLSAEARDQINAMLTLRLMHAQQALLTENQAIYEAALSQAIELTEWVYASRPQGITFKATLNDLKAHQVALNQLDISGSHTALKHHMKKVQQAMQEQLLRYQAQQHSIPKPTQSTSNQKGNSQ